ncbi:hypothetical protein ASD40_34955 [Paenibacillus sp. Root444D2]|nr:hypothetical protein ASD40_34955 [Paenibacillus sp. Root444D2]
MERNLLLAISFIMGFGLLIFPTPEMLTFDGTHALGTFLKNTLNIFGILLMVYSSIEVVIKLFKSRN